MKNLNPDTIYQHVKKVVPYAQTIGILLVVMHKMAESVCTTCSFGKIDVLGGNGSILFSELI